MSDIDWTAHGNYQDILYAKTEGIAKITINRPAPAQRLHPAHRRGDDARPRRRPP